MWLANQLFLSMTTSFFLKKKKSSLQAVPTTEIASTQVGRKTVFVISRPIHVPCEMFYFTVPSKGIILASQSESELSY